MESAVSRLPLPARSPGGDRAGRGLAWLFLRVEELGFEVGDAPVLEPQVGPRGFEPLTRVRLPAVSCRTRCLRVVFSAVMRWMASWVHSASRSRTYDPGFAELPGRFGAQVSRSRLRFP